MTETPKIYMYELVYSHGKQQCSPSAPSPGSQMRLRLLRLELLLLLPPVARATPAWAEGVSLAAEVAPLPLPAGLLVGLQGRAGGVRGC